MNSEEQNKRSEFDVADLLERVEGYVPGEKTEDSIPPVPALTSYEAEKVVGLRRENGALKLKKLKVKHREVLSLHIMGRGLKEIQEETGYTIAWISTIINDPLSQELLNDVYESGENELKSLMPDVIQAIRDALRSDKLSERLAGVDRYARLTRGKGEVSVEDNSTNITVINGTRERFIKELKEISATAIDVTDQNKIGDLNGD